MDVGRRNAIQLSRACRKAMWCRHGVMTDRRNLAEDFAERVERLRPERENNPGRCSHCGFETTDLVNRSRHYGGNVGGHWLCRFCKHTASASRLGAGGRPDETVQDVASMFNVLLSLVHGDRLLAAGEVEGEQPPEAGNRTLEVRLTTGADEAEEEVKDR